jgi:hypothetical protein
MADDDNLSGADPDRGATTPNAAGAKKPEAPFKRQRELDHALAFIRDSRFGVVGRKLRPYSGQLKDEAERLFGIDKDIYATASELQRRTNRRYFLMRSATLFLFVCFSAWTLYVSLRPCLAKWPTIGAMSTLDGVLPGLLSIVVAGLVLSGIRVAVRNIYFWILKHLVEKLSYAVKMRYQDIINDCRVVSNEIGNIAGEGEWSERARKSMIVALWHAIRADYLDRYSTTVLWKTDVFFEHAELAFWAVKIAIAIAVTGLMIAAGVWACGSAGAWLNYAAYLLLGSTWFWFNRKPNNFVENVFTGGDRKPHVADESASGPYFFAMADEIENLVKLAQGGFLGNLGNSKKGG